MPDVEDSTIKDRQARVGGISTPPEIGNLGCRIPHPNPANSVGHNDVVRGADASGQTRLNLTPKEGGFSINRADAIAEIFASIAGIQICAPSTTPREPAYAVSAGAPFRRYHRNPSLRARCRAFPVGISNTNDRSRIDSERRAPRPYGTPHGG